MPVELYPEQDRLPTPLITRLNEARGVIDLADLPDFELEPNKRLNIVSLAGAIGVALAETPRDTSNLYRPADKPLDVYSDDFIRSELPALSKGLYIPRDDPRYKGARSKRIAILADMKLSIFKLDGVQLPNVGVALSSGEHSVIVSYPRPLAARAYAGTLDSRSQNGAMNREDTEEGALRASGHVIEEKLKKMEKLDRRLIGQHALLLSMHNDARIIWRTAYLSKNLDRKRKEADELIHEIVEVAALSLNFSTPEANAAHRTIASNLYRRGSARVLAASWQETTQWAWRYINAKRGKINQSQNGCKKELRRYQPYLDAKRRLDAALLLDAEVIAGA